MKLVQMNNKIERHFCGIVMTQFLSSMRIVIIFTYYMLIFSQLFLTVNFNLGIVNLKMKIS